MRQQTGGWCWALVVAILIARNQWASFISPLEARILSMSCDQMRSFERRAQLAFEAEMVAHAKAFSPELCGVLGDARVRVAVHEALLRARGHGFTLTGPLRLFLELCFLRGIAFDTDPQFHAVQRALNSPVDEMIRAGAMYDEFEAYLTQVSGREGRNTRESLMYIDQWARANAPLQGGSFKAAMVQALEQAFPQKLAYIGRPALEALIAEGMQAAIDHHFTTSRQAALMVMLMFSFGHGCADDPLYPWINSTLHDPHIVEPAQRAERLERKALTWLEHALAATDPGAT